MAKKIKLIEVINLNALPKKAVPELIHVVCLYCNYKFSQKAEKRGLICHCPACGDRVVVR